MFRVLDTNAPFIPDHEYSPVSARDGDFECMECGESHNACQGYGGGDEPNTLKFRLEDKCQVAPDRFVAIVVRADGKRSARHDGSFASFKAPTEAEAVAAALKAISKWNSRTRYVVQVGELYGNVDQPVSYQVTRLEDAA